MSSKLEARRIAMRFRSRTVLSDFSLDVRSGEAVALVGENGSGKSTLLRILAGLLRPDEGDVVVRGRLGYCPQEPGLMELLTAAEHLGLLAIADGNDAVDVKAAGLESLERLGFSMDDLHGKVVRELSGGTRQKLNLALGLMVNPAVLLLDEPYQGFDRGAYVDFWGLVHEWRSEGRAVIIATPMLSELQHVDRVIELSRPAPPGVAA